MNSLDEQRVLLVHPLGYTESDSAKAVARVANVTHPIGLIGLAAYLDQKGFRTDVLDCYAHPLSDREFTDILSKTRPGYVGFSAMTSIFLDAVRMARVAKEVLPDIQIIFGGTHVSALKERILSEFDVIDYVVVGEGEQTVEELLRKGPEAAAEIPGLIYRAKGSGEVVFSGERDMTGLDLDTLPFPAYEKLRGFPDDYIVPLFNYPRTPATTCSTSRGCPYACSYCDRSVFRKTFRYNSAEYMYEHLAYLRKKYGMRHVLFYDDQFTYDRPRIETFCESLRAAPLKMTFSCAVRAEHIDEQLLLQMKKAGCWMISMGIESGDRDLLAKHRLNPDLDFTADRVRMVRKAGIRVKGLLMMGLPGETEDTIRRSMRYVMNLPLDEMNVARFTPFPGSPLYRTIRDFGTFDEDWEKMDCLHFQFIPKGMQRDQMERLFKEFYRAYFMRPKTILRYASMTWRSPDSLRRLFLNSGKFLRFARS